MPQGSKSSYSSKQKRQAQHIEEQYEKKGAGRKKAERIAWSTVNKITGGARKTSAHTSPTASARPSRSAAARSK